MSTAQYNKIDLSNVDRRKIKKDHGIDASEKIRIYEEAKELHAYPCNKDQYDQLRCYWDHHVFKGRGVSCPISYRPRQVAAVTGLTSASGGKKSAVADKVFVIKENIPTWKDVSDLPDVSEVSDSYYEVDGIFCSAECCMAFINTEKTKAGGSKYADSERLLHNMLGLTVKITPANSFRLLNEYGGNLTIQQFRSNNKGIKYEYNSTTILISHLFEKKINLTNI